MRNLWIPAVACCFTIAAGGCSINTAPSVGGGLADRPNNPAYNSGNSSDTYAFGETYEGAVDTTVQLTDDPQFTTSHIASPSNEPAWAVEMTFTNNTGQTFQPVIFNVSASVDGQASDEVIDSENGFEGLVSTPEVAPGDTATVPVAFSGEGEQHKVRVASMDDSEAAVFTDKDEG